jgi:hypothetical protein
MCLRRHIYMSYVNKIQPIRIKLICDMYMCRLRHINDPVLSSLEMEGIRFFLCVCVCVCYWLDPSGPNPLPYGESYIRVIAAVSYNANMKLVT